MKKNGKISQSKNPYRLPDTCSCSCSCSAPPPIRPNNQSNGSLGKYRGRTKCTQRSRLSGVVHLWLAIYNPPALQGNGGRGDNCYAGYWLCNGTVYPSLIDFVISALSPWCGEIMGYRLFTHERLDLVRLSQQQYFYFSLFCLSTFL